MSRVNDRKHWGKPSKKKLAKAIKSAHENAPKQEKDRSHENAVAAGGQRAAAAQTATPGKAQSIIKNKRAG